MDKFLQSVVYAVNGIRYALRSERNMRVHLVVFCLAMLAAWLLKISTLEFLLILAMSALTFALELVNTAVERLADRVSPEQDEAIGQVKDMMAGAVLVSSIFSVIIGLVIFSGPLLKILSH